MDISKVREYNFSVDNKPFTSHQAHLTGSNIKLMASIDPQYGLFLERHGNESDLQINDNDVVDLSEPGREKFYSVPPTTYGGNS